MFLKTFPGLSWFLIFFNFFIVWQCFPKLTLVSQDFFSVLMFFFRFLNTWQDFSMILYVTVGFSIIHKGFQGFKASAGFPRRVEASQGFIQGFMVSQSLSRVLKYFLDFKGFPRLLYTSSQAFF